MITLRRIFGVLTLLAVAACGGAGGGGGTGTADYQIEGVAATGAAMVGATISVNDSKGNSYSCANKTGTDGKYSCAVSGKAVPPLLMTAQIGNDDSTSHKSPVLDATPGKTSRVHITPLSNALIQIDWTYLSANGRTATEMTNRLKARKQQITAALGNVITEAGLSTDSFDFLTDSSFAANTGQGMDRLLDNISVKNVSSDSNETKFEIALKNTNDKATLGSTEATTVTKNVTPNTNVTQITSANPKADSKTKDSFVGSYTVNITFYSTDVDSKGVSTFFPPETKTVTFTVDTTYKITCTDNLADCSGTLAYDNNVATITITKGNTTLSGSIDNFFKVTATLSSKETTDGINKTTSGNVVGWKNKSNPTKPLSYFSGTYTITVPNVVYRNGNTGIIKTPDDRTLFPASVSGSITIGTDGKVTACDFGAKNFNVCTGGLVLKHKDNGGALFVISAKDQASSPTLWGTFAGSVNDNYQVSGTVNATIKNIYKFSGDFTGSPQAARQ